MAGLRQPELEHLTKHCNAHNLKMLDIRIKGTVIATNENTYIYIYIYQKTEKKHLRWDVQPPTYLQT